MGNVEGDVRRFPNFNINVTGGVYFNFADPDVETLLAYYIGDGVGVTLEHVRNFNVAFGTQWNNINNGNNTSTFASTSEEKASINSFNEFQYFTGITTIGSFAFSYCSNLSSIILPSTVTTIKDNAFRDCSNLTTINLSNVTSIGTNSFLGCTNLSNIDLSNITSLASLSFANCNSLRTVDLSSLNNLSAANPFLGNNVDIRNVTLTKTCQNIDYDLFSATNTKNLQTLNVPDIKEWTTYNRHVFPLWAGICPVDVIPFINVYQYKNSEFGLTAQGSSSTSLKQMYVGKIQTCDITFISQYKRLMPLFGTSAQEYSNRNARFKVDLLYLKDVTTLKENCFAGIECQALVINNSTPPTCTTQYYAELNEYQTGVTDVNVDTWGNLENATDPTADVQYYAPYSGNPYSNNKSRISQQISFIYVPDSAVSTYQSATGWGPVANKIKGISELNGGVKYATEADWVTAGKPLALIEEYM